MRLYTQSLFRVLAASFDHLFRCPSLLGAGSSRKVCCWVSLNSSRPAHGPARQGPWGWANDRANGRSRPAEVAPSARLCQARPDRASSRSRVRGGSAVSLKSWVCHVELSLSGTCLGAEAAGRVASVRLATPSQAGA